ncbi:MAG TPA: succinate dehydrogenase cytochrome b subunit [Roseiflexaceae bacterium]|nr:succinate dehydrogenase cytochrome b subunit [Roseiflexaceae bacterium]
MAAALTLYRSSIGKKAIMALTGLIGVGFLIGHMVGNLKVFLGAESFNTYAEFLREVGEPLLPYSTLLWIIRLVLLGAVGLHILAAYQLTRMDWAGRPVHYAKRKDVQATFASRTMRWGGVIILLFLIYHILDLTLGVLNPNFVRGDAYHNFVASFSLWPVTLFYVLAMLPLGLHLYHGFWSLFQTLGWNNRTYNQLLRFLAVAIAVVVTVGFIAGPLGVLFGIVA